MSKQRKKEIDISSESKPKRSLMVFVPIILFLAITFWLLNIAIGEKTKGVREVNDREEINSTLGLPADFPIEIVPLYAGVTILETKKESGMSTLGEDMDVWFIHSQIDSSRKPIFDFYHEILMSHGMAQTQFISVPSSDNSGASFAANYADETTIVELSMEKTSSDTMTQLKITVSRLRN